MPKKKRYTTKDYYNDTPSMVPSEGRNHQTQYFSRQPTVEHSVKQVKAWMNDFQMWLREAPTAIRPPRL